MEARFVDNPAHRLAIGFLPAKCLSLSRDILVPCELKKAVKFFIVDLPNAMLSTEYSDWVREWKSASIVSRAHLHLVLLSSQSG